MCCVLVPSISSSIMDKQYFIPIVYENNSQVYKSLQKLIMFTETGSLSLDQSMVLCPLSGAGKPAVWMQQ